MLFDLKMIDSALAQLEEERGISREQALDAIEYALATAYKKEYGKRGQIVRAHFNAGTGAVSFEQIKIVVDAETVRFEEDEQETETPAPKAPPATAPQDVEEEDRLPRFDPEKHILIDDAQKIKKGAEINGEIVFALEPKEDFGRIAAQTAKQAIIQKIREAEKSYISAEYGKREGEIVSGTVQRIERGNIFVDLGRATGILPWEEQIRSERFRQGERIRAYLYRVEESPRGVFLRLSRSHPQFLKKLFEIESPEVAAGTVEIKAIAREPGARSKVAVFSNDTHVDPVGALVGQRGVRVSTVTSELGGEKIDVIEWSENPIEFIEDALSPAKTVSVEVVDEDEQRAVVTVLEDQQSLAIGKGGQNVRLAAKLTGWKIDIRSVGGEEEEAESEESSEVPETTTDDSADEPATEETNEEKPETAPEEAPAEEPEDVEEEEKENEGSEKKTEA